jgi:TonB family protein
VQADGTIGEAIILRSLDRTFGLDGEAIAAVKQWQFVPGARDGTPVPVIITVELSFTLK